MGMLNGDDSLPVTRAVVRARQGRVGPSEHLSPLPTFPGPWQG